MIYQINSSSDAAKWHLIFTLLSMDSTYPFWHEMGLDINRSDLLQKIIRTFVREYRIIEHDASLDAPLRLASYSALFEETLDQIRHRVSDDVASAISDWGHRVFRYGDDLDEQAFLWRRLFRRLAGINNMAFPCVSMDISPEKRNIIVNSSRKYLDQPEQLEKRIRDAELGAKSQWDESIYAAYQDGSPMDWIIDTIEFANTRAAWREIEASLNHADLNALLDWARRQSLVMGMSEVTIALPKFE